jgi:predicted porin
VPAPAAPAPWPFQRQSEVNLSGSLGKLRLGRFGAATYFGIADYGALDEPNHDTGSIADALYDYVMRNTNKIAYRSPVLAGLTLKLRHRYTKRRQAPCKERLRPLCQLGAWPVGPGCGLYPAG